MSKKVSGWPLIAPKEMESGLPAIEETDEGKFLAVDQGEAVWADAPSGLPEITNSDEGKVLTVIQDTSAEPIAGETITEQDAVINSPGGGTQLADVSSDDFTPGTILFVTVDDTDYTVTMQEGTGEFTDEYYAEFGTYNLEADPSVGHVFFGTSGEAATYAVTIKRAAYPLDSAWAEPSGGGGVFVVTATYDMQNDTLTVDKTYSQIMTAYNAGSVVQANIVVPGLLDCVGVLMQADEYNIIFCNISIVETASTSSISFNILSLPPDGDNTIRITSATGGATQVMPTTT